MIRKTVERSKDGIVLIRVDDLSVADKPLALGYRLSTPGLAFGITDRDEAHAAFEAELGALRTPQVSRRRMVAGR